MVIFLEKGNYRKISLPIYLIALAITVLIFAIGVYVGTILDRGNLSSVSGELEQNLQRLESTQLIFFLEDSKSFCPVYEDELNKLEKNTERIGQKLNLLEDKGAADSDLKKQYFVLETQGYLLSKRVVEKCGVNYTLILYFYSGLNCERCREQGLNLLKARDLLSHQNQIQNESNIKIYSFDGDLGSSVANALKDQYLVAQYPTIIVNGKSYSGYKDAETLAQLLKGSG